MDGYFSWTATPRAETLNEAVKFFNENGYVVFTSHASEQQATTLRAEAQRIMDAFYAQRQQAIFFSTEQEAQKKLVAEDYFLRSATKVRCFLEEKQLSGEAQRPAINKIGHALHELHAPFDSFSRSAATRELASAFGFEKSLLVQSMYILKNARVGGAVTAHRDASFVRAQSDHAEDCLGLWWALERSTLQNGCLWVIPGSQKHITTPSRRLLAREGRTTLQGEDEAHEDSEYTPLEMQVGDVAVLHGGVLHRSLPNSGADSRHAYSIHVVRGGVARDSWLRAGADGEPFRAL